MTKNEFALAAIKAQYDPDESSMTLITVYDKPSDYPSKFVARLCYSSTSGVTHTEIYYVAPTLIEVVKAIPKHHFTAIGRDPKDEFHIVGVWI